MKIIVYPAGRFGANCYIVYDEETLNGVIIDAGDDAEKIIDICRQNKLEIKYIILTHGHFDHIGAVSDVKSATGAEILMNQRDEFLIYDTPHELRRYYKDIKNFSIDKYIKDNDKIEISGIIFNIIETPGHTPGGICIKADNYLFSGDTLFRSSIGRTDFKYGDFEQIISSIKIKLFFYDDNTIVYPGHGSSTTIGYEKLYNNYL